MTVRGTDVLSEGSPVPEGGMVWGVMIIGMKTALA